MNAQSMSNETFWQNICDFIAKNTDDQFVLLWKDLLFGLTEDCRDKRSQVYIKSYTFNGKIPHSQM